MKRLNEGLRNGDLDKMILPLLSIDQWESKIDDTALVIAFFVSDKDAADDLNRFLQKSAVFIIDTDVSIAPDQRNYWKVFVEIADDAKAASRIVALTNEVGFLAGLSKWTLRMRHVKKTFEMDEKVLDTYLTKKRKAEKEAALQKKS